MQRIEEVEMGIGAESFSSTAYSGTCGRHGQWYDSKNFRSKVTSIF